jgi:hypothetical protein
MVVAQRAMAVKNVMKSTDDEMITTTNPAPVMDVSKRAASVPEAMVVAIVGRKNPTTNPAAMVVVVKKKQAMALVVALVADDRRSLLAMVAVIQATGVASKRQAMVPVKKSPLTFLVGSEVLVKRSILRVVVAKKAMVVGMSTDLEMKRMKSTVVVRDADMVTTKVKVRDMEVHAIEQLACQEQRDESRMTIVTRHEMKQARNEGTMC